MPLRDKARSSESSISKTPTALYGQISPCAAAGDARRGSAEMTVAGAIAGLNNRPEYLNNNIIKSFAVKGAKMIDSRAF